MRRNLSSIAAIAAGCGLAAASVPVAALVGVNLAINLTLPAILNQRPDRMRVDYQLAWMLSPGHVHVRGLRLEGIGATDAWVVHADEAHGTVDLGALRHRAFDVSGLAGRGVTFRYSRGRPVDAPDRGARGPRWSVALTDVTIDDLRQVDYGDHQLTGSSALVGSLVLDGSTLDATATVEVVGGALSRLHEPLGQAVNGVITLSVDGLDRRADLGPDLFRKLSGEARIGADVGSLGFMSYYLDSAPWLTLGGSGHVDADLRMTNGAMTDGSVVAGDLYGVEVGFLGWVVTGDCRLTLEIGVDAPGSELSVDFGAFEVSNATIGPVLVEGRGFNVTATSPDVGYDAPFTTAAVALNLPPSQIADLTVFNALLPSSLGVDLAGGDATIRGRLEATTLDDTAFGDVWVDATRARAQVGDVSIVGDVAVHGRLREGDLARGRYDIAGSEVALTRVSLETPNQPEHGSQGWFASVGVASGALSTRAARWVDVDLALNCRDSTPFLTLFAETRSLPGWIRRLTTLVDVEGEARVQVGPQGIDVTSCALTGDTYEVLLNLRRRGQHNQGALFARLGQLSLGLGIDGKAHHLQILRPRAWYDDQSALDDAERARWQRRAQ